MFCTKVEKNIKLILIISTRVTHVLKEPIVSTYNRCEPTSSEILPYFLTKSFCGLAVVRIYQFKLNDGWIPQPSFNLIVKAHWRGSGPVHHCSFSF